jgi:hypothetical protein
MLRLVDSSLLQVYVNVNYILRKGKVTFC